MNTEDKIREEKPYEKEVVFGPGNKNWNDREELNLIFLRGMQNYLNDKLKLQGHLFLNEVYDELGLPRTVDGAIVGWILKGGGDWFVDFGVFDITRMAPKQLKNYVVGRSEEIILKFNVDGVIYDKIEKVQ